jgi:FAD/FMN-containing dehydrogenase/Fe-S oxidoreductase
MHGQVNQVSRMLERRLKGNVEGKVLFDRFSRGRYSTDASLYQIEPIGVVIPKTAADLQAAIAIAAEEGVSVLPRGGGTSQAGQTVGASLVIDCAKHLTALLDVSEDGLACAVEPGLVLDELNRRLKPRGVWFPVDVSTGAQCTIGGMAGNNSAGTRSLRYGIMRDRVTAIDAILHDSAEMRFAEVTNGAATNAATREADLTRDLLRMGRDYAGLAERFPDVSRRVGGYNIDALAPNGRAVNLATLLVGSEGTLAVSKRIELKLAPLPKNKAVGVCHFPTFRAAMEAAQHIVKLGPVAVEVVDRTLIELARDIPAFRASMDKFVRGRPDALLLTEFAEDDQAENLRRLKLLDELMADLGHPNAVVEAIDPAFQYEIWEVRKSGLNIMMSMRSDGKPVSFIEDCAVPLEHLADYTTRLTDIFHKHGTKGTWYAHASVGCLHVRPAINLKTADGAKTMRAIAEEAFELVREYKGSHSGEHGDGLVRSEFHEAMYGREMVQAFEAVKDRFDPQARMNPGKIVRAPKFDDRTLLRYKPDYAVPDFKTALDWSAWPGAGGGFQGAVEMCNNNGHCRKLQGGVMCPSYRATMNERDVTRGRANSLRLAISGQLGPDALASDAMLDTMKLCVSCKACRNECPTSVDMAKMKIEVLAAANKRRGLPVRDRFIAYLPRYAPYAARAPWLLNARNTIPGARWMSEKTVGLARGRALPRWRSDPFRLDAPAGPADGRPVILLADTFNTYFEPENLRAAVDVLAAAGCRVQTAAPHGGGRPICCGRTFLAAGMVDEARAEARRFTTAALPHVRAGAAIVGLEPSCLFSLKDEFQTMGLSAEAGEIGAAAHLLSQFLLNHRSETGSTPLKAVDRHVHVHGHCHQKSFGSFQPEIELLNSIPKLKVTTLESSCCGMAGAFGYNQDTYDVSLKMAELNLLPSVRKARDTDIIAACGFSCRHQIKDGAGRTATHPVHILRDALA